MPASDGLAGAQAARTIVLSELLVGDVRRKDQLVAVVEEDAHDASESDGFLPLHLFATSRSTHANSASWFAVSSRQAPVSRRQAPVSRRQALVSRRQAPGARRDRQEPTVSIGPRGFCLRLSTYDCRLTTVDLRLSTTRYTPAPPLRRPTADPRAPAGTRRGSSGARTSDSSFPSPASARLR